MPFIKSFKENIYIWRNSESLEELKNKTKNLEKHLEQLEKYKSPLRKQQYLTTRILLQETIGSYVLKKGENNKPYLKSSCLEISFTHNQEYTLLMVSNISCGIDVQKPTPRTIKIRDKFINKNDFCYNSTDYLLLSEVWSCKEAAFKKFGNHSIFLKENITVRSKSVNNVFDVLVHFKNEEHQVFLKLEKLENNYVLYTLN